MARRDVFIAALAAGETVQCAAAAAGPSTSSAYRLYRRDARFAARWDEVFAARRAAMAAAPLPSREPASTTQLIRWLAAGKRRGHADLTPGRTRQIDANFMNFMNLDAM